MHEQLSQWVSECMKQVGGCYHVWEASECVIHVSSEALTKELCG